MKLSAQWFVVILLLLLFSRQVFVDHDESGQTTVDLTVDIPATAVDLWWPVGYGSQPLYNLSVTYQPEGVTCNKLIDATAVATAPSGSSRRNGGSSSSSGRSSSSDRSSSSSSKESSSSAGSSTGSSSSSGDGDGSCSYCSVQRQRIGFRKVDLVREPIQKLPQKAAKLSRSSSSSQDRTTGPATTAAAAAGKFPAADKAASAAAPGAAAAGEIPGRNLAADKAASSAALPTDAAAAAAGADDIEPKVDYDERYSLNNDSHWGLVDGLWHYIPKAGGGKAAWWYPTEPPGRNWDQPVGFKEVSAREVEGESFYFRVNGVPVFAKGANLIPLDILSTRVMQERLRGVLEAALDANMNMIRIWGGGLYQVRV